MVASLPHFASFLFFFFFIVAAALLISPVRSLTCTSQTFSQRNTNFRNCTDLPALRAFLHWTYDPTARPNPTLEVAFIAPPASPEGWVAWALNPTGPGMVGAQALIAFRDANGSMIVKTYNLSSYGAIVESKISYDVLSMRAEYSEGVMRIFATVELPSGSAELISHVWQVGASVRNGVPERHNLAPENLSSKNTLRLAGTSPEIGDGYSPAPASRSSVNDIGGSSEAWRSTAGLGGLYGNFVLFGVWISGVLFRN